MKDALSKQIIDHADIIVRATMRNDYPNVLLGWTNLKLLLNEVDDLQLRVAILCHETKTLEIYEKTNAA